MIIKTVKLGHYKKLWIDSVLGNPRWWLFIEFIDNMSKIFFSGDDLISRNFNGPFFSELDTDAGIDTSWAVFSSRGAEQMEQLLVLYSKKKSFLSLRDPILANEKKWIDHLLNWDLNAIVLARYEDDDVFIYSNDETDRWVSCE